MTRFQGYLTLFVIALTIAGAVTSTTKLLPLYILPPM